MKAKFGLFCIDKYDAAGGLDDMVIAFNDVSEVESFMNENSRTLKGMIANGCWELVDFRTLERHQINASNLVESIRHIAGQDQA